MSQGNTVRNYNDNPYFDGVTSALTTQGEVTFNCRVSNAEYAQRRANMRNPLVRATSYDFGDNPDVLAVMPHELVFGWISAQGRNNIPGHPNHIGFTTLNGVNWGATSNDAELLMRIRFIGLAKTPFRFEDKSQLQHGFSAIAVGSGTTVHTGELDFFPGDPVEYDTIPRPLTRGGRLPGGQYGDAGPGSRQGNPTQGTPRGKFRLRINPSNFTDMRPSINAAISAMNTPSAQGGVSDIPFERMFMDSRKAGAALQKMTPNDEHAKSLEYSLGSVVISGGAKLVELGLLAWAGAVSERDLVEKSGLFETRPERRTVTNAIMDNIFLDFAANKQRSANNLAQLKQNFPAGFRRQTGQPLRNETLDSRYAQVRTNLAQIMEMGFARAVHFKARRRIGTALSYSKKGQRLDILLGHFIQSY